MLFSLSFYLVIAVIAATLFPLWPAEMRVGVYYLSVGAGCFVASILLLAVGKCRSSSLYQQGKSKSGDAACFLKAVRDGSLSRRCQQGPGRSRAWISFLATGCQSCAADRESAGSRLSPVGVSWIVEICLRPLFKNKIIKKAKQTQELCVRTESVARMVLPGF